MGARSFAANAQSSHALARALEDAREAVRAPVAGVVFCGGPLAYQIPAVAELVRTAWRGVCAAIVPAAGVLTERGEIEGAGAASGILWSGGRASPFALATTNDATAGVREGAREAVLAALAEARGPRASSPGAALLFAQPEGFHADVLEDLAPLAGELCVFGAGTAGGAPIVLAPSGAMARGPVAGLVLAGLGAPVVETSPACRLLTALETADDVKGGMILRIGGRPALDVLSSCAGATPLRGPGQPIVFAAVALGERDDAEPERFVVRPVRGVDPPRGGVLVGGEVQPGMRVAFGIRDPAAARADLEAAARRVSTSVLGAAPRFALYMSCAGRGKGLYGASDVESRILRRRFGDLPIAGMCSSFEIAPLGRGRPWLQLYTGVLALFRSAS